MPAQEAVAPREAGTASRIRDTLLAMVAVGAAAVAFRWLPAVYFDSDDFVHLYEIVNLPTHVFLLNPHGGHLNVVRNLVFSLTYAVAGYRPEWFMTTVLVTHLLNVWLLFRVIRLHTGAPLLACLGAALWGSAPDAEGTLAWYSVYGQVLATTVLLVIVQSAGKYAVAGRVPSPATVGWWVLLTLAGAMCFGSGLPFGVLLPVVLTLLVPGVWREGRTRLLLLVAPIGVVALYLLVPAAHHWLDPIRSEPDAISVLREGWWLRLPLWQQLWRLGELIARGLSGLVGTDDVSPPWRHAPLLFLWLIGCAACLRRGSTSERRRLAAFLLLTAAAYGVLLAARGFSAKLTMVPRYHYYAQVPLVLTVALLLERLARRWTPRPMLALGATLAAVVIIVAARGPHGATPGRTHQASRAYMQGFDATLTAMATATPEGEVLYIQNAPRLLGAMRLESERFPGHAALFCVLHPDGTLAGRRVQFVDPDAEAIAGAAGGRCSAGALIEAVPPLTRVEIIPRSADLTRRGAKPAAPL